MTAGASRPAPLPRAFYARPTLDVARDLIGKVLVHRGNGGVTAGAVVEVEAYIGEADPACHAAAGPTPRNAPMYGPPGHAYVYFNYGVHYLVNVVTEAEGTPAAVLLRALAPLDGVTLMRQRRGPRRDGTSVADHDLCRGPGNLTRAMGIGPGENRADLTEDERGAVGRRRPSALWIEDRGLTPVPLVWGPRIGIRVGADRPWRCCVDGHASVSGRPPGAARVNRGGRR